jgi:hypothetical protein
MRVLAQIALIASLCVVVALGPTQALAADPNATTPRELVDTYQSLADVILGARHSETHLVQAIIGSTYRHAEGLLAKAKAKLATGKPAREEVEGLAALVSQLANEGDASVAAVRKRLIEGGHHHNAAGEQQGVFDEGFVVVTKAAKKNFLAAAAAIGKLAAGTDAAALDAAWQPVAKEYAALGKAAH